MIISILWLLPYYKGSLVNNRTFAEKAGLIDIVGYHVFVGPKVNGSSAGIGIRQVGYCYDVLLDE